jgi:hypothetical protein
MIWRNELKVKVKDYAQGARLLKTTRIGIGEEKVLRIV